MVAREAPEGEAVAMMVEPRVWAECADSVAVLAAVKAAVPFRVRQVF